MLFNSQSSILEDVIDAVMFVWEMLLHPKTYTTK
jgi:hypothetical protein